MIRGAKPFLAVLVLLAGCSLASAQDATIGAGKVEIGGFPGGGTFFVGGDDNKEVNFNVYTAGGGVTYYFSEVVAFEGEFTGSVGWAQDVYFNNEKIIHNQMPTVWSYAGNLVFFPGGAAGRQTPFYVTGGIGQVLLSPRVPTKVWVSETSIGAKTDGRRLRISAGNVFVRSALNSRAPVPGSRMWYFPALVVT
jgi:hypothetical protein